jgi:hypothetical protein
MNDFMRDKFTPKKGEGTIPLYGEVLAGGTVSQEVLISVRLVPCSVDLRCMKINIKNNKCADITYMLLNSNPVKNN